MPNLEKEISNHNRKTHQNFNEIVDDDKKLCDCRIKLIARLTENASRKESFIKLQFCTRIRRKFT